MEATAEKATPAANPTEADAKGSPISPAMLRVVPVPLAMLLPILALMVAPAARRIDRERILDAIRFVESGGRLPAPDGDGGLAIGPFQIHRVYWQDAVEFEPALGGTYQDCRDPVYAAVVVRAYMRRWAPDAWRDADAEVLARLHNGGPLGPRKASTERYWQKVRRKLEGES